MKYADLQILLTKRVLATIAAALLYPTLSFGQQSCPSTVTSPFLVEIPGTLSDILIDDNCEYIYAANLSFNRVEVFSIAKGSLETPIHVGSLPRELDTSPSGDLLYVANFGEQNISVVNLETKEEDFLVTVPERAGDNVDTPYSIAVTSKGLVLFATNSRMMQMDPAKRYRVSERTDFYAYNGAIPGGRARLSASKDRSKVVIAILGSSGGPVFRYDSARDDFGNVRDTNGMLVDIATDRTGTWTVASRAGAVLDRNFRYVGRYVRNNRKGVAVDPDGEVGYLVSEDGDIEILSLESLSVIGSMSIGDTIDRASARMAISSDGKLLAVVTDNGFTVLPSNYEDQDLVRRVIVFSSEHGQMQSFLRFYNSGRRSASTGAERRTVNVTLADLDTGETLAQWDSGVFGFGSDAQVPISSIEDAATHAFDKPPAYLASIRSTMRGKFAHIVRHTTDGTLTNLSSCGSSISAEAKVLFNVHASTLSENYPSTINVVNTGPIPIDVSLGIYAPSNYKYGEYKILSIPPDSGRMVSVDTMEKELDLVPTENELYYVVKVENDFPGFLQHLVDNRQTGALIDMTHVCTLPGP